MRRSLVLALFLCALLPSAAGAWIKVVPTQSGDEDLWATVNQCDSPQKPGAVGVRVAIPDGEGGPEQWARIHLQWFDGKARAWRALASADAGWQRLGVGARPVEGGTTFSFKPPAAGARLVLRGVVEVEWRKAGEVVDSARLVTSDGHEDATDRHLKVSRTSCEIVR